MSSSPPSSSVASSGDETIAALHSDIILALILTRLDGPNLASTACVSSHLRSLSAEENLWRDICYSTWPSVNQPRIQQVISTFPSGHRSFFSDAFPFPDLQPLKSSLSVSSLPLATELISAVDIYYQGKPICSKVVEMDTSSNWFLSSPFRVDLLGPNDPAPMSHIKYDNCNDDTWLKHLEENLSLSWIVIDVARKKSVNMSGERAVCVQRHWLTGNVQVRFGTVFERDERWGSSKYLLICSVVVTCGGIQNEGDVMHVMELSLRLEDMDGKGLSGEESLVLLRHAMESGRSLKSRQGKGWNLKYEEFEASKRQRKERTERQDRVLDLLVMLSIVSVCGAVGLLIMQI